MCVERNYCFVGPVPGHIFQRSMLILLYFLLSPKKSIRMAPLGDDEWI